MKTASNVEAPVENAGRQTSIWSIGIFSGAELSDLRPYSGVEMPVISARDVTDVPALFTADPFMIRAGNAWYMFFEVMNDASRKGEIGLATSGDGRVWRYERIVLTENFHLSYPYVFSVNDEYYMIPESYEAGAARLYRADPFPYRWRPVKDILEGPWVDSSLFFFGGRWWLFSNPVAPENRILELFHAGEIAGPWTRHPMSPLVRENNRLARSAGRVLVTGDRVIRFAQDCTPYYGTAVRAFEILELTTSAYRERELAQGPVLAAQGNGWRQNGMHHIDAHSSSGLWLACVDGWRFEPRSREHSKNPG